jgi:GMP synthase PP-ATPase subunit
MDDEVKKEILRVRRVATVTLVVAGLVQVVASQKLLDHCRKLEDDNKRLRWAGLYFISILERENVHLTEFDKLAYEALRPDKPIERPEPNEPNENQ